MEDDERMGHDRAYHAGAVYRDALIQGGRNGEGDAPPGNSDHSNEPGGSAIVYLSGAMALIWCSTGLQGY